jgi:hypothetical protein
MTIRTITATNDDGVTFTGVLNGDNVHLSVIGDDVHTSINLPADALRRLLGGIYAGPGGDGGVGYPPVGIAHGGAGGASGVPTIIQNGAFPSGRAFLDQN